MWTLQDAKNRFSAVVDAALEGQPQEVSRRGNPAVVVIAASDYRRLLDAARHRRGSFKDHLLTFPGVDEDVARAVPRDVEF
ncbi:MULTISPECIES: type II toxin-antitoxin system Phd/YefM family antitoxin [unclassified Roseitalea]|uniref:type II toxin-antitoxin system Phd/YefM family antitoxin n=1 Tax=unclassified Roseitalea TaxID=2639107 RepID=UPI00273D5DFA|nr:MULTISPECIES: type II toxin-antitoxin system Phd/YefM family antitoxin [unclassified Roseitalea]